MVRSLSRTILLGCTIGVVSAAGVLPASAQRDPPDVAFVERASEPFGTFDGVEFIRHTGILEGETSLGGFRMPYEIVAPADPAHGNGTVLVEPPHFTQGLPGRDAILGREFLFGPGTSHASVGYGEHGLNLLDPARDKLRIAGRPAIPTGPGELRGGPLDEEILVIFAIALADHSFPRQILGNAERLYAFGASQTASSLLDLRRATAGTEARQLFDFTLLHSAVWDPPFSPGPADDPDGPFEPVAGAGRVIFVESEGDQLISAAEQFRTAVGSSEYRVYEVAGAAHYPTRTNPLDHFPVARAMFVAGDRWVREGVEPPPSLLLESAPAGAIDPLYGAQTGIARDSDLNARGGVRLPDLAVGRARFVATDSTTLMPGNETGTPTRYAGLTGSMVDLACEPRPGSGSDQPRFQSHEEYVEVFNRWVDELLRRGFLLEADGEALKARGAASDVGRPGTCPPPAAAVPGKGMPRGRQSRFHR